MSKLFKCAFISLFFLPSNPGLLCVNAEILRGIVMSPCTKSNEYKIEPSIDVCSVLMAVKRSSV